MSERLDLIKITREVFERRIFLRKRQAVKSCKKFAKFDRLFELKTR
ncbi:hypothetical protein [Actinobacillus equuli]|nr:hypothetical protein [Actinobacillus equuli]WGE41313.1 hypothetical protein NYR64_06090 [Actinobacillus equuli subsp. haemolyticus]